jgi:translation initiation factor 2 beta subunit (eIF-2beta)/eIF-5
MDVKIFFRDDDDPELPAGEKSVFEDMDEALRLEEMQQERMLYGCLEAHIALYYELHQQRMVDEWTEGSLRFMNEQCQECGSTEGYSVEDERCVAHRRPPINTVNE